jgi:hypothetical protein
LAGIAGIYIPGRDANPLVDTFGWGIVLLSLLGSIGHGLMRVVSRRKH